MYGIVCKDSFLSCLIFPMDMHVAELHSAWLFFMKFMSIFHGEGCSYAMAH